MIIKKAALGNRTEAFIENRFTNKTNIIFSNENNRGKTLLMQCLVYSLGYDSIFPSGFDTKKYFFYSEIEIENRKFEFLRKGNSILVLNQEQLYIFNSITEFKYYFDQEIYTLPKIDKEGQQRTVDLSLLYELFFLGQDKRNTSNLIVKGQNNKVDFLNMIYSMEGITIETFNKYDVENLKKERTLIDSKIKAEIRKISIIKKNPEISTFISAAANNIEYRNFGNQIQEIHQSIAELKKKRNREENRRAKLHALVIELNSLNRNLNEGKVKCGDCGSSKIIFTNDDFKFEVSNNHVRQNILISIKSSIQIKEEIISEFNHEINKEQEQINKLLENSTPEIKNYILFQDEIYESKDVDKIVLELQNSLNEIENKLKNNESKITSDKERQKYILESILKEMKRFYDIIDPQGLLEFEDLFTKATETFSGSEGQEYYFCKIMALNSVLAHQFPIIIDSFREGELSTSKEMTMLDEFLKLDKQVILTSTLKKEEYSADKYFNINELNVIDYSNFEDSKILQESYVKSFSELLVKFNVKE
jgi:hypothetical protein